MGNSSTHEIYNYDSYNKASGNVDSHSQQSHSTATLDSDNRQSQSTATVDSDNRQSLSAKLICSNHGHNVDVRCHAAPQLWRVEKAADWRIYIITETEEKIYITYNGLDSTDQSVIMEASETTYREMDFIAIMKDEDVYELQTKHKPHRYLRTTGGKLAMGLRPMEWKFMPQQEPGREQQATGK